MNYRGRLDIIADVLSVASREAKRTQIMYQANLSYKILLRYLDEVVAASLVSFNPEQNRYILTEKGKNFLITYREYFKTSKGVEKRLDEVRRKKLTLEELCRSRKDEGLLLDPT
jgi:predicted transcriptional regulator